MKEVLFATSNPHKVEEADFIGGRYGIRFVQLHEPYPEVRDEDVAMVAKEGASFVYEKVHRPLIVEDTGLFIHALEGFPGSYSAFVYRKIGCEGILRLLTQEKDRRADFVSAIGFCDSDGVRVFVGSVSGRISEEMRGEEGFGYDPIFMPEGSDKTFAEDPDSKNMMSHRSKAFERFCQWLNKRP